VSAASTRTNVLRLGTRRSALATVQAEFVAAALRSAGHQVELVGVTTEGDRSAETDQPLVESGGTGVFVGALRSRLLAGDIDLVVHSLKDLPTAPHDGLMLAAIPLREDPRDVLVTRDGSTLAVLAAGSVVGTGSPRRAAQLRSLRSDLVVPPIRGNVDTRLRKVAGGEFDAVVLAAAGLARLGRLAEASEIFDADVMLPAPGQGALAIECRDDADPQLLAAVAGLDDPSTRLVVVAERAVLATLEAGCTAPVGAYAVVVEPSVRRDLPPEWKISLTAAVVSVDGTTAVRQSAVGSVGSVAGAHQFGEGLAVALIGAGAGAVMGERT
jgi:hydroxymethylbilane synthase